MGFSARFGLFLCAFSLLVLPACVSDGEIAKANAAKKAFEPFTVLNNVAPSPNVGISKVVSGLQHTCAIRSGKLSCWGLNKHGQIGNGEFGVIDGTKDDLTKTSYTARTVLAPFDVFPDGVTDVAVGYEHTCAIRNGELYCWGSNIDSQLGLTAKSVFASPTLILQNAKQVAASGRWTCAVADEKLLCFGTKLLKNERDTVPTLFSGVPVIVISGAVKSVALSSSHACAVVGKALRCFGLNDSGEIGNGDVNGLSVTLPFEVFANGVTFVSVAEGRTCALQSGIFKCFGLSFGDRKIDETAGAWRDKNLLPYEASFWNPHLPGKLLSANGAVLGSDGNLLYGSYYHARGIVQKIALGIVHFDFSETKPSETEASGCMLFQNHQMKCWGSNLFGQLGTGSRSAREYTILEAKDVVFK